MSLEVLIWIALAVLLVMGTPIFVSLGMASITVLLLSDIPLSLVMIDLIKVSDMFPLLAVVGFVFAGALMERGGMAAQIVEVASMLVGHIRGGLGIVTILGCMFFASMIGSGPWCTSPVRSDGSIGHTYNRSSCGRTKYVGCHPARTSGGRNCHIHIRYIVLLAVSSGCSG